jgi:hypothetical protein
LPTNLCGATLNLCGATLNLSGATLNLSGATLRRTDSTPFLPENGLFMYGFNADLRFSMLTATFAPLDDESGAVINYFSDAGIGSPTVSAGFT